MTPNLLQFRFSHFNEKARWALDYKGVDFVRTTFLPGFHIPQIVLMSGQKSVPILRTTEGTIAGSGAIAAFAERVGEGPALFPSNATDHAEALRIQTWFDDEIGPATRAAFFTDLFQAPDYALSCMIGDLDGPATAVYRASFGLLRRVIVMDAGATPAKRAQHLERIEAAEAFIAERAGEDGFLVGDTFTIADLTAAALLAPLGPPQDGDLRLPADPPKCVRGWVERWFDRPAAKWMRTIFSRYRG